MPLSVQNSEKFAKYIEHVVRTQNATYLEAIIQFCAARNIEPEAVAPYISDKMKNALAREGARLHLLPKTNELPLDE